MVSLLTKKWAYYNDSDPFACAWTRELIKVGVIAPGEVDERPIQKVEPSDLAGFVQCHFFCGISVWSYALRRAGWPDADPVWTGSCPCQSFSASGLGLGFDDPRHLWPAWRRLIRECRPDGIFGEQVASPAGLAWLDVVSTDLEDAGYAVGAADLCAAGVGAPHIRQRLYFVAESQSQRSECGSDIGRTRQAYQSERYLWSQSVGLGSLGIVADTESRGQRIDGRASGHTGHVDEREPSRQLGDAEGGGRTRRSLHANGVQTIRAPQADAFWVACDWLPCRDGKWRPVEPKYVAMAPRFAGAVGFVCSARTDETKEALNADTAEADTVQDVPILQRSDAAQEVSVRRSRVFDPLQSSEVLRPTVHGGMDGRPNQEPDATQQSATVGQASEADVRSLRPTAAGDAALCASQGRESLEQRERKLADFVRLLPSSLALAQLHGDRFTADALLALLAACGAERLVQYPSDQAEAVWRSLDEESKSRFRLAVAHGDFVRVPESPLVTGAPARVVRLRGYGNSLNAQVAAAFIASYLDVKAERCG